jgi:hypothetical protein
MAEGTIVRISRYKEPPPSLPTLGDSWLSGYVTGLGTFWGRKFLIESACMRGRSLRTRRLLDTVFCCLAILLGGECKEVRC